MSLMQGMQRLFAIISFFASFALFSAQSARAAVDEAAGKVVTVIGAVTLKEGASAEGSPLRPGTILKKGQLIETGANGKAKLLMTDRTVLDLSPSTKFKVEEYSQKGAVGDRNVTLGIEQGKVRTAVSAPVSNKGKFVIKTKTTTMGVRGTEFIVASQLASLAGSASSGASAGRVQQVNTEITVIQGKIEVVDATVPGGKPIEVTTGKQLVTSAQIDMSSNQIIRAPASTGGAPSGASGGGTSSSSGSGSGGSGTGSGSGSGSGEAKGDGSGGGTSTAPSSGGGPKVVDVPPSKLDQIRNDAKVGDLTFKDSVNIEEKSKGSDNGSRDRGPGGNQSGGNGSRDDRSKGDKSEGKGGDKGAAGLASAAPSEGDSGRNPASTGSGPPIGGALDGVLSNIGTQIDQTMANPTSFAGVGDVRPNAPPPVTFTPPIIQNPIARDVSVTVKFKPK